MSAPRPEDGWGPDHQPGRAKSPLWFQLYPQKDMDVTKAWVDAAQGAGGKAVVMTVDQQATYYERAFHDRHLVGGGEARPAGPPGGRGAPPTSGPRAMLATHAVLMSPWQSITRS